jgi:hypothetical protein
MASLIDIVVALAITLIGAELIAYAPSVAKWLVGRAVRRLRPEDQERFAEEWLAHAEELPGAVGKLLHGASCYVRAARRISQERYKPQMTRLRLAVAHAVLWAYLGRTILGGVVGLAWTGDLMKVRFFLTANRLVIKTLVLERVVRGKSAEEVGVSMQATFAKIRSILGVKE